MKLIMFKCSSFDSVIEVILKLLMSYKGGGMLDCIVLFLMLCAPK